MRVRVFRDTESLAEAAAGEISAWLSLDDADRTIGLAGGSTPRRAYELLRDADVRWKGVHAWMTDERHVPIDDPVSNAGMASEALFSAVPATLHPVPYDEDPQRAAVQYRATIAQFLPAAAGRLRAGLVMLGIGDDGHTASLFPETDALTATDEDFVANWVPAQDSWRLTATFPLLLSARRTIFMAAGKAKADVVAEILEGEADYPASVVSRGSRDVVWLLDREAAANLYPL